MTGPIPIATRLRIPPTSAIRPLWHSISRHSVALAGVPLPTGITQQYDHDGHASGLRVPQLFPGGRSPEQSFPDLSGMKSNVQPVFIRASSSSRGCEIVRSWIPEDAVRQQACSVSTGLHEEVQKVPPRCWHL